MSDVHTKLLLAQIDVPVKVLSINRGLFVKGKRIARPTVTLEAAGQRLTLRAGDEIFITAEGKFERP